MIEWVNKVLTPQKITNLTSDLKDGIMLSRLVNLLRPGTIRIVLESDHHASLAVIEAHRLLVLILTFVFQILIT